MKKWFLQWGPIIIALFGSFYPFAKDLLVWFNEAHMTYEQIGFKIFTILSVCYLIFVISYFLWGLNRKINELHRFSNDLKKWIGFFSYRDSNGIVLYTDLKGKIKRYIQEELEIFDKKIGEIVEEKIIEKRLNDNDPDALKTFLDKLKSKNS